LQWPSHVPRLENSAAGGAGEYFDHGGGDCVFVNQSGNEITPECEASASQCE